MAPGNRSSLIGVQPLPMIRENPDATPPTTPPQVVSPKRGSLLSQSPHRQLSTHTIQERLLQTPSSVGLPPTHLPPAHSLSGASPPRHHRQHSNSSGSRGSGEKPPLIPLPEPEKDWFARKGGWCRLSLYAGIFIVIIVALGVGLSIGLKKDSSSKDATSNEASTTSTPSTNGTGDSLPTGAFAFVTTLVNASLACSEEWTCNPIGTDNEDSMKATFHWVISRFADGGYGLTDEAADDPLGIEAFANVSISLLDEGASDERLQLTLTADKAVVIDNQTICYFTDANIVATIWTGKAQDDSVPAYTVTTTKTTSKTPTPTTTEEATPKTTASEKSKIITTPTSDSAEATATPTIESKRNIIRRKLWKRETEWGYAVSVVQTATGSPTCKIRKGRAIERPRQMKRNDNQCGCWYANFV